MSVLFVTVYKQLKGEMYGCN